MNCMCALGREKANLSDAPQLPPRIEYLLSSGLEVRMSSTSHLFTKYLSKNVITLFVITCYIMLLMYPEVRKKNLNTFLKAAAQFGPQAWRRRVPLGCQNSGKPGSGIFSMPFVRAGNATEVCHNSIKEVLESQRRLNTASKYWKRRFWRDFVVGRSSFAVPTLVSGISSSFRDFGSFILRPKTLVYSEN